MAVSDLVQLFESIDHAGQQQQRHHDPTSTMKLSLQTMFHPSPSRARGSAGGSYGGSHFNPFRSPRTPSRRSSQAAHMPLTDLSPFPPFSTSSSPSSTLSRRMRRQPSAIDVALEEERYAEGPEHIGLGLFEPRPRACTSSSIESNCSLMEFMNESQPAPVVLDGIFEVMEGA